MGKEKRIGDVWDLEIHTVGTDLHGTAEIDSEERTRDRSSSLIDQHSCATAISDLDIAHSRMNNSKLLWGSKE